MSLKKELQSEKVIHLDLANCCQVSSGTSVRDALSEMRKNESNACLVLRDGRLEGILTDRDVLHKVAAHPAIWDEPIDKVMTSNPITVSPETSAAEALWTMDENHFRNLPVVDEDGRVLGNMTHQTIVDFLATRYPVDVLNRSPRPEQFPRKAEGGD